MLLQQPADALNRTGVCLNLEPVKPTTAFVHRCLVRSTISIYGPHATALYFTVSKLEACTNTIEGGYVLQIGSTFAYLKISSVLNLIMYDNSQTR